MVMMMMVVVGDDGEEGLSTDYVGLKAEKLSGFRPPLPTQTVQLWPQTYELYSAKRKPL